MHGVALYNNGFPACQALHILKWQNLTNSDHFCFVMFFVHNFTLIGPNACVFIFQQ